jgi:acyl-coenzyme A thioesterase PaaI-like protein
VASFEDATELTAEPGDGEGQAWTAQLDPQWSVGGRPHGGYLLALLARAALAATPDHPHPLSASAVYASSPEAGPAQVRTELIRKGRTASHVRGRLTQDGRTVVEALFVTGALDPATPPRWTDAPPPQVAPIDQCRRSPVEPRGADFRVSILEQVGVFQDLAWAKAASGDLRGWISFDDGKPFDPLRMIFAADAFPPATFTLGSVGWVPTLELTLYLRGIPAPGPLQVRQRARVISHGFVDQVCEGWDSTGKVVFQATQLAAVRMPDA